METAIDIIKLLKQDLKNQISTLLEYYKQKEYECTHIVERMGVPVIETDENAQIMHNIMIHEPMLSNDYISGFINESLENAVKFLKNEIYIRERDRRVYSEDPLYDGKMSKDDVIKMIKDEAYEECQEQLLKACDEIFK